ncbi:MAG: DUF1127 domain-containing protein [Pseudomonadota bacterium]
MLSNLYDMLSGQSEADKAIEALQTLNDHELADLGIARDQIAAYVRSKAGCAEL